MKYNYLKQKSFLNFDNVQLTLAIIILFFSFENSFSQSNQESYIQDMSWRNIGPANMGGRVVDIEAYDDNFKNVYLASASGGVWKSVNAGTTWEPIFNDYGTSSIGDIAISQKDRNLVWVGTGEANNRNSVSWGDGVYKSTDGGKTFTNMGLKDTYQIGRIIIHPDNPNTVYVAAVGLVWGNIGQRGLFKTTDGGKSWNKLSGGLPTVSKTGATDLVMDPKNSNTLYVAFYERLRKPWNFNSGGPNGGIFKSTNGGKSWKKLTKGLPTGDTGRIGLAISRSNPKVLMASVEAERSTDLNKPGSGLYRSENGGNSWTYVNTYNNRPMYYSQVRINPINNKKVYFLTTRFMVSEDGGYTLTNGSEDEEIHGDFHAMWLDPQDEDRYYIGEDKGPYITHDGGKTFTFFDNLDIAQYYRIGVDMRDPYYVYGGLQDNGTYGGPSFSRDARGILSDSNWKLHWGDGQHIQVDPTDWKTIYTEMETGRLLKYNAETHEIGSIAPTPRNTFNYAEVANRIGSNRIPLRFNWTTPMHMSQNDPSTLYFGGNYLFKSTDKGNTWKIISPDLSTNDESKFERRTPKGLMGEDGGAESHSSLTALGISKIDENIIWGGTDDGNLWITRDGGNSWTDIKRNVPEIPDYSWVSRIIASNFHTGTAYLTYDTHRSADLQPWVFKTNDFGNTWTKITSGIPSNNIVKVIIEDIKNENLLFLGTEFGVYASFNKGKSWVRFNNNMPNVTVRDLVIHPRDNDLVAGTHGRGIWIMDDITALQQITPDAADKDVVLFDNKVGTIWENISRGGQRGHDWFAGKNPPTIENTGSLPRAGFKSNVFLSYYLKNDVDTPIKLEISDLSGENKFTDEFTSSKGIHKYKWNLKFDPASLIPSQINVAKGWFNRYMQNVQGDAKQKYADGLKRFSDATTDRERRKEMLMVMGASMRGFNGFPGKDAGAGVYKITLTVNGRSYTNSLEVRNDPILLKK